MTIQIVTSSFVKASTKFGAVEFTTNGIATSSAIKAGELCLSDRGKCDAAVGQIDAYNWNYNVRSTSTLQANPAVRVKAILTGLPIQNSQNITIKGTFSYKGSIGALTIGVRQGNREVTVWRITGRGFDFRLTELGALEPAGTVIDPFIPIEAMKQKGLIAPDVPTFIVIDADHGGSAVVGDGSSISYNIDTITEGREGEAQITETQTVGLTTAGQVNTPTVTTPSTTVEAPAPVKKTTGTAIGAGAIALIALAAFMKGRKK